MTPRKRGAVNIWIRLISITLRSKGMRFMTIVEWERDRPPFDVGFSISSFEHDGREMYGDPLDADGDLKAMRKMKERIKPVGLLFLGAYWQGPSCSSAPHLSSTLAIAFLRI
jgi:hypothetical protein